MTICFVLQISLFIIMSSSAFPTADRHAAHRAYLDALRAADGLPPITGRPVTTTVAPSATVTVSVVAPPGYLGAVPAPPVAPTAVVSLLYFSYFVVVYLRAFLWSVYGLICDVLTYLFAVYLRTYLQYTYILIVILFKNKMWCVRIIINFYCSTHPSLTPDIWK